MEDMALCHSDRKLYCRGLCRPCYRREYERVLDGFCECGCGSLTKRGKRFVQGHWAKTDYGRMTRRESVLGKTLSEETKSKMSQSHIGHKVSENTILSLISRNKTGWQKTVADKISKTLTGRRLSSEHVEKIKQGAKRGKDHMWWKGGVSKYPSGWDSIKREVRIRDDHFCLNCSTAEFGANRAPDVHHIDGNKQNCDLGNLVSLCRKCHALAENNMKKWIPKLRSILLLKYGYVYD